MAKNEIKVRKQVLEDSTLQRHRNYSLLLQQHERAKRLKYTQRFFIYSLLVAVVVIILLALVSYFLVRLEKGRELKQKNAKTSMVRAVSKKNLQSVCDFLIFQLSE